MSRSGSSAGPTKAGRAMQEMVIYGVSFDMVGKQPIVLLKTVSGQQVPADLDRPRRGGGDPDEAAGRRDPAADDPRPAHRRGRRAQRGDRQDHRHGAAREHVLRAHHAPRGGRARSRSTPARATPWPSRCAATRRSSPPTRSSRRAAIEFEHEVEDTDEVVEKFKEFLDQVSPGGLPARTAEAPDLRPRRRPRGSRSW